MDRLIRSQNDDTADGWIYLYQGETETRIEKGVVNAQIITEASGATHVAYPHRRQKKRVALTGATPIMILMLMYTLFLIFQRVQPILGYEEFETYKVDLQNDPAYILELLPGIGSTRAEQIVLFRKDNRISSPQDVTQIHGIGQKTVDSLWYLTKSGSKE